MMTIFGNVHQKNSVTRDSMHAIIALAPKSKRGSTNVLCPRTYAHGTMIGQRAARWMRRRDRLLLTMLIK